jgi:hypothetical protein
MQNSGVQPIAAGSVDEAPPISASRRSGLIFGLAISALIPALFWVSLCAGIARLLGHTLSFGTLLLAGSVITVFLGVIFAMLAAKPD